jgi:hypothetical protein
MKARFIMSLVLASSLFSGASYASDANKAGAIGRVAQKASALTQRILSRSGAGGGSVSTGPVVSGPQTGPSTGGGIRFPWEHESDALALPIFMQSAGHLNQAANSAFESQAAFLSGQIQFGLFKFTTACSRLSIGKSSLARANLAALQPPVGFFGVFNVEVLTMLNEIETARITNGCL